MVAAVLFQTVVVSLYVAGFAVAGFSFARLSKPTPDRGALRAIFMLIAVVVSLRFSPWSVRAVATCATLIAGGIAWYFGARERKREGRAAFAHPPFPEGHKPTFVERALRLFTPLRSFGVMLGICAYYLLSEGAGTQRERAAREHGHADSATHSSAR